MFLDKITSILGDEKSKFHLEHECKTFDKNTLYVPSPNFIDDVWSGTNRNIQTLKSLNALYNNGRLSGTGLVLQLHQILDILTLKIL